MEVEISFKLLFKSLIKHFLTIMLIVLIAAILTAVYTQFFVTPVYMAKTASNLLVDDLNATQGSNLSTTINMMSTYAVKVKSDKTMEIASNQGLVASGSTSSVSSSVSSSSLSTTTRSTDLSIAE